MYINIGSLMGKKGAFLEVKKDLPSEAILEVPSEISQVLGPIETDLLITNLGDRFLLEGQVKLEVKLRCSRCLESFPLTLLGEVSEEFLSQANINEDELFPEEELIVEDNELELSSLIHESILISVPMKPVCSQDCLGLCSSCGVNLASENCLCDKQDLDIRLTPLQELLESMESEAESLERRKDNGSTKKKTFKSKG